MSRKFFDRVVAKWLGQAAGITTPVEKQDDLCHKDGSMHTKTAIISVENLKSDDLPKLRETLQAVPGVESVEFSLERSVAVIEFEPQKSHIDTFLRVVLKSGFEEILVEETE